MRGFLDIFFKVVSVIGHPILLPTYFALTVNDVFGLSPFIVGGMTFVFPMIIILFFFAHNYYKQKMNEESKEGNALTQQEVSEMQGGFAEKYEAFFETTRNRTKSLFIVLVFSVAGYLHMSDGVMMSFIMLLTAISSLVCLLINNFWRISIHSFGWGFALYILLFKYPYVFINGFVVSVLAILAGGLVLSSRLYLGRHNNLQVHLGFVIGAAVPALFYWALSW